MNLGMFFSSVFRIQVYLPEEFLLLLPNQNDNFHCLTGSGTVVYYPLKIHSVLLKNNLQECCSVDYYHTFSSYIAARGHSGFSPKDHDSPRDRGYPHSPAPLTTTGVHTIPHFLEQEIFWEKSLFPATIISIGAGCFYKYTHTFPEHHYKRKTLVMVTGAKET